MLLRLQCENASEDNKVASICYCDGGGVLFFVACCFYKTQKQHIGTKGLVKRLLFSVSFIRLSKKPWLFFRKSVVRTVLAS